MPVRLTFKETMDAATNTNSKLTRNAIAVHAKVRPATLHAMYKGDVKSIPFETLGAILDAMNELDDTRSYDICDIFEYTHEK